MKRHRCHKCVTCDKCGVRYCIGYSVACKDGHARLDHDHRPFVAYWDEHVQESNDPRGTLVTSHYQRMQLLKRNKSDFRGRRVGDPGCQV